MLLLVAAPIAWSQRQRLSIEPNVPYDGRFTFVRLRYTQGYRMAWSADYPLMERNFMTILGDLSTLRLHKKASNVHVGRQGSGYQIPPSYKNQSHSFANHTQQSNS